MGLQIPQLANWFEGGITGKKIVTVGDSTTDGNVSGTHFQARLAYYQESGRELEGVTIADHGTNGQSCAGYNGSTRDDDAIAEDGDLYIFCLGINDVRQTGESAATIKAKVVTAVDKILTDLPNTCVVLRVPNPFQEVDDAYLLDYTEYDTYSNSLYTAYTELAEQWDRAYLFDTWATVFTGPMASHPLLADSIHPNQTGYYDTVDELIPLIAPEYPFVDITSDRVAHFRLADSAANVDVHNEVNPAAAVGEFDSGAAGSTSFGDLPAGCSESTSGSPVTASRTVGSDSVTLSVTNTSGSTQRFGLLLTGVQVAGKDYRAEVRLKVVSLTTTPQLAFNAGGGWVLKSLTGYTLGEWVTMDVDLNFTSIGSNLRVDLWTDAASEAAEIEIDYIRTSEVGVLAGGDNTTTLAVGAAGGPGYAGWTINDAGFALDGTADRVTLQTQQDLSAEFTLSIWGKRGSTTDTLRLFGLTSGTGDRVEITDNTTITVQLDGGTAHTFTVAAIGTGWAHVFVRRDADDDIRVYVDGTESSTGAVSDSATLSIDGLGLSSTSYDDGGSIAEARIYDADLGEGAAASLLAGGTPVYFSSATLSAGSGALNLGLWDAASQDDVTYEWVVANAAGDTVDSGTGLTGTADLSGESGNAVYLLARATSADAGYGQGDYATRTSGYGSANDGYYELATTTAGIASAGLINGGLIRG